MNPWIVVAAFLAGVFATLGAFIRWEDVPDKLRAPRPWRTVTHADGGCDVHISLPKPVRIAELVELALRTASAEQTLQEWVQVVEPNQYRAHVTWSIVFTEKPDTK